MSVSVLVVSALTACTADEPPHCAYMTERVEHFRRLEQRVDSRPLEQSLGDLTEFLRTLDSADSEAVKDWQLTLQDLYDALKTGTGEDARRLREFAKREADGLLRAC